MIAKGVLLAYTAVAVIYIVIRYSRRSKKLQCGKPVRPDPNPGYFNRPVFAPTPLPDWAYLEDRDTDPDESSDDDQEPLSVQEVSIENDDRVVELISDAEPFLPNRRRGWTGFRGIGRSQKRQPH